MSNHITTRLSKLMTERNIEHNIVPQSDPQIVDDNDQWSIQFWWKGEELWIFPDTLICSPEMNWLK